MLITQLFGGLGFIDELFSSSWFEALRQM